MITPFPDYDSIRACFDLLKINKSKYYISYVSANSAKIYELPSEGYYIREKGTFAIVDPNKL